MKRSHNHGPEYLDDCWDHGTGHMRNPFCDWLTSKYFIISDYEVKDGHSIAKMGSEYDQEIPQSQTAHNPMAPRGRVAKPSQDNWKRN